LSIVNTLIHDGNVDIKFYSEEFSFHVVDTQNSNRKNV